MLPCVSRLYETYWDVLTEQRDSLRIIPNITVRHGCLPGLTRFPPKASSWTYRAPMRDSWNVSLVTINTILKPQVRRVQSLYFSSLDEMSMCLLFGLLTKTTLSLPTKTTVMSSLCLVCVHRFDCTLISSRTRTRRHCHNRQTCLIQKWQFICSIAISPQR